MPNTVLSTPVSSSWRESYEIQNLIEYEAPNMKSVFFIYDNVRVSGGHSVDNIEYPNYGGWYNTAINETTNKINVIGFLRSEDYLSKKIDLVNALKIKTDDENPAFIFIPLWGRIRVVLNDWTIEEVASENGQCKIELTLSQSLENESEISSAMSVSDAIDNVKEVASENLEKDLKENFNYDAFISSINSFTSSLSNIIGKIQAKTEYINKMSQAIKTVSTTIAQGVKTPAVFAQAISNVVESITNGIIEIKQAAIETADDSGSLLNNILPSETAKNNEKKTAIQFLDFSNTNSTKDLISDSEIQTAKKSDNFMKTIAITAVAALITKMDATKDELKNYIKLYDKLNSSINKDDYKLNAALTDLKISIIEELNNRELASEKKIKFNKNMTLLNTEHYLQCYKLRDLNFIEDSFVLPKEITYI